jgi:predicted metal-binding membrane protein
MAGIGLSPSGVPTAVGHPVFRLVGVSHGLYCLGCCWALMLVGFAAGAGNLLWMAGLTTVMAVERTAPWGKAVVRPLGLAFVALAAVVLLHPVWLPPLLGPS